MGTDTFSRSFLLKSAAIFAIITAVLLILLKGYAYYKSKALSIEASLLDSLLDCFVSIINFFAIRHALIPADSDHGFGHGKVEALAGLLQSFFIAGSALWLCKDVVTKIFVPEPILFDETSILIWCLASFLTLVLVLWQKYVIYKTQSIAISADCLHYQTDLFANIIILLSIVFLRYFDAYVVDFFIAIFFVFYILKTSYQIGKISFDILMDRELDDSTLKNIRQILGSIAEIEKIYTLKTRSCGQKIFIHLDIGLNGSLSLNEVDMITATINSTVQKHFEQAEVFIQNRPFV